MNLSGSKKIKKCIKIVLLLQRLELMTDLQYRINFLFTFLATTAWLITEVLFLGFLLQRYDELAGWSLYEIGLLLGANQFWVGGIFYFVIWPSLPTFAEMIRSGAADRTFTLPINTRFYVSLFRWSWASLSIGFNGLIMIIYCLLKLHYVPTLFELFTTIILMMLTGWVIYCIQFIAMSVVFWITNAGAIQYILDPFSRLARFPYEIFGKGLIFFLFTFVFPITLVVNVPIRALMGILEGKYVLYLLLVAVCLGLISHLVWKAGLKKYESASS